VAKAKSSGRFSGIGRYLRETRSEIDKVVWPTRDEATNLTIVVLAVTFGMAIMLGTFDYIFQQMFALLFG